MAPFSENYQASENLSEKQIPPSEIIDSEQSLKDSAAHQLQQITTFTSVFPDLAVPHPPHLTTTAVQIPKNISKIDENLADQLEKKQNPNELSTMEALTSGESSQPLIDFVTHLPEIKAHHTLSAYDAAMIAKIKQTKHPENIISDLLGGLSYS